MEIKKKILVTGASGLIGEALVKRLAKEDMINSVVAASRSKPKFLPENVLQVQVGDLLSTTDWNEVLSGISVVVHCAGLVHLMRRDASNSLESYREVNVSGTIHLARTAALMGVRRFVFVSSIKVNGENTRPDQPFTADDKPAPLDPYGLSKLEAELCLREIEAQTGMEVVIVRPPLVYGPGVKANFAHMIRWVSCGIPLPFGSIHNSRSMVALENLVDLLVICSYHPSAAGHVFLVSDGEDVSTTELLRRTAEAMGRRIFLLPMPTFMLKFFASLLGKRPLFQRLCGSLQVDMDKTRRLLNWSPPLTLAQGLKKTVEGIKG